MIKSGGTNCPQTVAPDTSRRQDHDEDDVSPIAAGGRPMSKEERQSARAEQRKRRKEERRRAKAGLEE